MTKKAYRVRNWHHYNRSLVNRGSLTFWFSEEVIDQWKDPTNKAHGNQVYSDMVITCGLTIRQLFRLPLRSTEGLMRSIATMLRLNVSTPNFTTLSRRSRTLTIELKAVPSNQGRHIIVDSTGVQVMGESEWKHYKYGVEKTRYQTWRKLHISMDADTQDILAAQVTESVRLDGNYLAGMIETIPGVIDQITGDGAYDKKSCYQAAYGRGAKAVFPPQHNACIQRNKHKRDPALEARDRVIKQIGRGTDRSLRLKEWKQENNYHRRSLVETMMFRMKSIFGDQIRSRRFENQRTDLLIRCDAINKMNTLGLPVSEALI